MAFKVQIICLDDGGSDLSPTDAFLQNHGSANSGVGRNLKGQLHV